MIRGRFRVGAASTWPRSSYVGRLEKYAHGRPAQIIYALRSEIAPTAFEEDCEFGFARSEEHESLQVAAIRPKRMDLEPDDLLLDAVSVIVPSGGGARVPVRRMSAKTRVQLEEVPSPRDEPLALETGGCTTQEPLASTGGASLRLSPCEVALALERGPEVALAALRARAERRLRRARPLPPGLAAAAPRLQSPAAAD